MPFSGKSEQLIYFLYSLCWSSYPRVYLSRTPRIILIHWLEGYSSYSSPLHLAMWVNGPKTDTIWPYSSLSLSLSCALEGKITDEERVEDQ